MKRAIHFFSATLFLILFSVTSFSQDYSFEDFIGTWHGTISSTSFGGYNDPITMTIEADGFYTETSGHLMPTLYPGTQQCEYQASTNRMHWWYLGTAWGGQYFYDHHFYEVVYFNNDTLEMHYNFWDDPQPNPDAGTIFLIKEGATVMAPPTELTYQWINNSINLNWEEPSAANGQLAELTGYHVFHRVSDSPFELLAFVETNSFMHEGTFAAGQHTYYVTAVYEDGESNPSGEISVNFLTPSPTGLEAELFDNSVALSWNEPSPGNNPMATIVGYNVYHKSENTPFGILAFAETTGFTHENITVSGTHTYYVTAVYTGGHSVPSNEVEIELVISGLADERYTSTQVYPNPAVDFININSDEIIRSVKLVNYSGQMIISQSIDAKEIKLALNEIPAGLYIVLIQTEKEHLSKRIFVK